MVKGTNNTEDIKDLDIQKEVVSKLIASSCLNHDFYLMIVLSAMIVSFGLILDSIVIIIGGMLVTPFLSPLLMLSLAFVISDKDIIKRSVITILKSAAVILLVSAVVCILVPKADIDLLLVGNIVRINLSYFYVSLVAGAAAAYAWARPNLSSVLPGVAISVTLLPPLVSMAVAAFFMEGGLFIGALRSTLSNILGIILSATFVFALLGFYRVREHAKKEIKVEEIENGKKAVSGVKQ